MPCTQRALRRAVAMAEAECGHDRGCGCVWLAGWPQGELVEPVKADDCMWNLLDSCVEVQLTKSEGMHWWPAVVKGEPEIDTQKVEPENSKLTDLDGETRQTVEKMMVGACMHARGCWVEGGGRGGVRSTRSGGLRGQPCLLSAALLRAAGPLQLEGWGRVE